MNNCKMNNYSYHFRKIQAIRIRKLEKFASDSLWLDQSPLGEVYEKMSLLAGKEVDEMVVEVIVHNAVCHETSAGDGTSE